MKPLDDSGLGIYLPLTAVFPMNIPAFEVVNRVLNRLDRWNFVLQCSRGIWDLLTSWDKDTLAVQKRLVQKFFTSATYPRLLQFERQHPNSYIVPFFRHQFLEAIRWSLVLPLQEVPAAEILPSIDDAPLQAILGCSELIGERQIKLFASIEAQDNDLESKRRQATIATRTGTEIAYASRTPTIPIARAARIFGDLLLRHMPSFPSLFRQAVGLDHSGFLAAQGIIWALITSRPEDYPIFTVGSNLKPSLSSILHSFIDSQCISFEDLKSKMKAELSDPNTQWSLQPLRAKPLVRQPDNGDIFLLPDPRVFIESMTVGPIFSLVDRVRRQEAIEAFGHAVEDYAGEILRNAYPESSMGIVYHHDTTIDVGRRREAQIDGYLNYGHAAVLCEIKASFIRDDAVLQQDSEQFLLELKEKYIEKADGSPKAVAQLANAIELIQSGKWLGDNSELSIVKTIWPLLIVHDEAVDDPLALHLLAKALQDRLLPGCSIVKKRIAYGRLLIAPLCILSIDILELLETSFSRISLLRLLEDYDQRSPDRMISLHNFLAGSQYSDKLLPNQRLNAIVSEIVKEWKVNFGIDL